MSISAIFGVITMGVRRIKKGCHAEALEAGTLGIAAFQITPRLF